MYQSVFKDIWGSDLIFAGPHKTFTDGNKTSNINHITFGIHSVNSEPEDEGEYTIITNTELGLTGNLVPLNPEDLLDVGGEICIPADSDEQDTWTDGREYAVIADNELGLTVHLFPTNPQHILDVGGEVCIPADRE